MTEEEAAITVRDLLQDNGYKAKLVSGQPDMVESAASGLGFYVITYSRSFQFRAGIKAASELRSDFARINRFNSRNRFAKVYCNDEAIVIESDSLASLEGQNTASDFQYALQMWELSLAIFRDWVREAASEQSDKAVHANP